MPRLSAAVILAALTATLPVQGLRAQTAPVPTTAAQRTEAPPQPPPPPRSPVEALPAAALPAPFGVSGLEVSAERERPQACFGFTQPLPRPGRRAPDLRRFVTVEPGVDLSVQVRERELCLEGLAHGQAYTVTLAPGLPDATGGEALAEPVTRAVTIPDRRPALSFRGQGYILPRIGGDGLPLRSLNVDRARLQIIRIADRQLVEQIYYGRINQTLTDFDVGAILEEKGEVVWRGEIATGGARNRAQVTAFPIDAVLGSLQPGVYIAVAENAALPVVAWDQRATQWFVVSDVGLTSFRAANGLFVFARSIASAAPMAGVEVRLVARDNSELGRATTGEDGVARFPADRLAATGPKAPQALFAASPTGGFSLLDFVTPAVELSGRTEAARPMPGDLDVFVSTERAIYRPGDTVQVVALLRDARADAAPGRELIVRLQRPDGLDIATERISDKGLGGHVGRFILPATAPEGTWTLTARTEPSGPVLGRAEFQVGEVIPPRLTVSATADRPRIAADGRAAVRIDGRYLHGTPAARLPGEMRVSLRVAENPWPALYGYRFGLVQEPFREEVRNLPGFTTGAEGTARIPVDLPDLPRTSHPLEAVMTVTLHDIGGRAVQRDLVVPVDHQAFALGIRPNFVGDAVPEGAMVGFEVVAVAPDGRLLPRPDLSWELYEEEFDYDWFEAEGRWDYRTTVRSRRLTGGSVDTRADGPVIIEEQVKSGRYRLEVFDPGTGIASAVRFSAGWWVSARVGETPETVEVAVQEAAHAPGGTARVFVRPPYAATVLVTVADRAVRHVLTQEIGPEGAFLDLPLDTELTAGAYVLATAYAPSDPRRRAAPRRAVGMGWISAESAQRRLDVAIQAPDFIRPGGPVSLPVTVTGLAEGEEAFLVVRAVDEALLTARGTRHRADPSAWFHGRRDPAVELRDVYGRLDAVQPRGGLAPVTASAPATPPEPREDELPMLSLQSAVFRAGPDGQAEVTLDLPESRGRLGLEVLAWSAERVGRGEASLNVRDPVQLTADLPGILSVGDTAQLYLALENLSGPRGAYQLTLEVEGPFTLAGGSRLELRSLPRGRRVTAERTLTATGSGNGELRVLVTGPEGYSDRRILSLQSRPATGTTSTRTIQQLASGQRLDVPANPESARVLVAGVWPDLDIAGLLLSLGSPAVDATAEIAGHLLPLLEAPDIARTIRGETEPALRARAQELVDRLVARQRADGAFAPWSVDGAADPWLTAFALDVLVRAREAGYQVPEPGYRRGMDWLVRTIGNSWVHQAELPARAYALYVAARAKVIDAAPVRYFQDTYFARLQTRLSQAHLAGAFALLGDADRARAAIGQMHAADTAVDRDGDLGSDLRDRAATLALLAASGADVDRLGAMARDLAAMLPSTEAASTQERAWLISAAARLARRGGAVALSVNGQAERGEGLIALTLPAATEPPVITNAAERPLTVAVTVGVTGGADMLSAGFDLTRTLHDTRGNRVDPAAVRPGDLLVMVLKGKAQSVPAGPVLVMDRVPAGLAVENVKLAGAARLGGLSWLGELTRAIRIETKPDLFAAALEGENALDFSLAYLVRAVGEGRFAWPGAEVQDMVDGSHRARTPAGALTIARIPVAPTPAVKPRPVAPPVDATSQPSGSSAPAPAGAVTAEPPPVPGEPAAAQPAPTENSERPGG